MEAKYEEITLMEPVAEKIKSIYFPDKKWPKCFKDVAKLLSVLKKNAKKFYVDKNNHEIAMELSKYSESDLKDMLNV